MISARAHEVLQEARAAASAKRARASGYRPRVPKPSPPADPPAVVTDDRLEVFVRTTLVNPLNAREHRMLTAKRAKAQREVVALAVFCALHDPRQRGFRWSVTNVAAPKAITLTGHVARLFDSDGLQAALKAVRDSLIDCGLIRNDDESSGHAWTYAQVVDGRRGVTVRVELR